jgi:hypothetical protein
MDQESVEGSTNQPYSVYLANPQNLNSYSYVINNPLRYTDVSGEFLRQIYQGWIGFSNSVVSNFAFGLGRSTSNDQSFQTGQTIGDVTSMVIGAAEAAAGITTVATGTIGGVALSPIGVGVLVGVGVSALGATMTTQGIGIGGTGAYYFSKKLSQLDIVPSAEEKLNKVSGVTKMSKEDILNRADKSGVKFIDNNNNKNVNIFTKLSNDVKKVIRVTLDPSQNKIISAGFNQVKSIINNIVKGRFIHLP